MEKEFVINLASSHLYSTLIYEDNGSVLIASLAATRNYIKELVKVKSFIIVRDVYNVYGADAPTDSIPFIVTKEMADKINTVYNKETETLEVHVFGIHYDDWIKTLK